jgi:hypothetical protein
MIKLEKCAKKMAYAQLVSQSLNIDKKSTSPKTQTNTTKTPPDRLFISQNGATGGPGD